jgi:transposase-like protein
MPRHKNGNDYTDDERIAIIRDVVENEISYNTASEKYNVSRSSIERWSKKYKHLADTPDNHAITGTSRYYKLEDGGVWVKTSKEVDDAKEKLKAFADGLKEEIPRVKASFGCCSSCIIN